MLLETLLDAQLPNALDGIELTLGSVTKTVNIHVPVNFIIGNMQGGDKICACSPCYSNKMQWLFCKCNVKGLDADNLFVKCHCMIMAHIQAWVVHGNMSNLITSINIMFTTPGLMCHRVVANMVSLVLRVLWKHDMSWEMG